jgi:4a-hydroxytetrahydrobiopterin dehydratase
MSEATDAPPRMSAKAFHARPGVEDWRVLFWGAYVHYACDSLTHAVELASAVGRIAEEVGHSPDLDVRPHGVTVRTSTQRNGGLGPLDAELARRIQEAARAAGYRSDPSRLQVTGIAVAQDRDADVRPFWATIMGYELLGDEDAIDPQRRGPHVWVHELDPPKPGRGRTHIDVSLPADQAEARVAAALAAGGRLVNSNAPHWWTIASPENHGIDIAAWPDFEDFDEED